MAELIVAESLWTTQGFVDQFGWVGLALLAVVCLVLFVASFAAGE